MIGNWRQNIPWYSVIWLDIGNIMTCNTVPLLVEKLCVNIFFIQFKLLYKIFHQILRRNERKYKQYNFSHVYQI